MLVRPPKALESLIVARDAKISTGCAVRQVRSLDRTRSASSPSDGDDSARMLRGLEIGINDYLVRPIDKNELLARMRTQVRRKRYTERLRDNVQLSMEMAITDVLTGLHNRRYMESHLGTLVEQAAARGKPLSVLILDIDYFKAINDSYGHESGDEFCESSRSHAQVIRGSICCRLAGRNRHRHAGDDMAVAATVAGGCAARRPEPFPIEQQAPVEVTISMGAVLEATDDKRRQHSQKCDQGSIAPSATPQPGGCRRRLRLCAAVYRITIGSNPNALG